MKISKIFFLVIIILILSGCSQSGEKPKTGILKGKISIGPLCPVERNPPDPNCRPTEETFKAWPISVFDKNRNKITQIKPDSEGNFRIELGEGHYIVDLEKDSVFGRRNLPAHVMINAGETYNLDIEIDTGIR